MTSTRIFRARGTKGAKAVVLMHLSRLTHGFPVDLMHLSR